MKGIKVTNEYVQALGEWYRQTPKAVFAAIAYSYAVNAFPNSEAPPVTIDDAIQELTSEWSVLHTSGIVAQSPVRIQS